LNIGLKALGGKADATVFLNLDTSASLVLSLDASAGISTIVGDNSTASDVASSIDAAATTDAASPVSPDAGIVATKRDDPTATSAFGGCVQVNAGLGVNAGAKGEFFGVLSSFDLSTATHHGNRSL
jgi:hypothetical protein